MDQSGIIELDGAQREALATVLKAVLRELSETLNGAHITAQQDPEVPMEDLCLILKLAARRHLSDDEGAALRMLESVAGVQSP